MVLNRKQLKQCLQHIEHTGIVAFCNNDKGEVIGITAKDLIETALTTHRGGSK